jgi:hypothetical protein
MSCFEKLENIGLLGMILGLGKREDSLELKQQTLVAGVSMLNIYLMYSRNIR